MIKLKLLKLMPVLLIIFLVTILMGCSSTKELADDQGNRKNANGNNSKEVVSTSSLTEKTSINKENLEAIHCIELMTEEVNKQIEIILDNKPVAPQY